ncbi:MAG: two-component regulator propeller domain-containing protein [Bacteroidales bacterium]
MDRIPLPKNLYAFTLNEDWQNRVWVGLSDGNTGGALGLIEDDSLTIVSGTNKIPDGSYHNSKKLPDGSILFGGSITGAKGKPLLVWVTPTGIDTLQIPFGYGSTFINCISIINRHEIWIGSANGLIINKRGKWQFLTTHDGLPDNFVNSIHQDFRGMVWVGTEQGIAYFMNGEMFKPKKSSRVITSVTQFFSDNRGYLWCGAKYSSEGVSVYNGQVWETFSGRHGLIDNSTSTFFQDQKGRLWVGSCYHRSRGGVSMFNGKTWQGYTSPEHLAKPCVDAIAEDSVGRIWFGGSLSARKEHGITILDNETWYYFGNSKDFPAERVLKFFNDSSNTMWISSLEGLFYVDIKTFKLD